MRISKKAVWMRSLSNLMKPAGVAVLILWFISGNLFIYFALQNLSDFLEMAVAADKWIFLALSVILLFLIFSAISRAFYEYLSFSYEIGNDSLKIVKGLYQKKEIYIPYKNIQRVDIEMSAGERFWGLAAVLIFTSTVGDNSNPESAEGYIRGLHYSDAATLKDELLKRSNPMTEQPQPAQPTQ